MPRDCPMKSLLGSAPPLRSSSSRLSSPMSTSLSQALPWAKKSHINTVLSGLSLDEFHQNALVQQQELFRTLCRSLEGHALQCVTATTALGMSSLFLSRAFGCKNLRPLTCRPSSLALELLESPRSTQSKRLVDTFFPFLLSLAS